MFPPLLPIITVLFLIPASAADESRTASKSSTSNGKRTEILTAPSKPLGDTISIRGDETARTIYRANGKRYMLEVRGLITGQLIHGSVAIEERQAGFTRRLFG